MIHPEEKKIPPQSRLGAKLALAPQRLHTETSTAVAEHLRVGMLSLRWGASGFILVIGDIAPLWHPVAT